jgi:methylase of polypeptide subunit release factors
VAEELELAGDVLDIATGSAYYAMALAREHPDIHVTAIDIDGLKTARENVDEAWERFGDSITEHGMGHYSRLELFVTWN